MREKTKAVLIVDDEQDMCDILKEEFTDLNNGRSDIPYTFDVDVSPTADDAIQKVQTRSYDVIVLDVRMEGIRSGLEASFKIYEYFGVEVPIRIIFTGYPNYRDCVQAMRYGAWDYIIKEDVGETLMARVVVDSAVERLRELSLRQHLERKIATDWLPQHFHELQEKYAEGRLLALWEDDQTEEITEIGNGSDAFELEDNLKTWREQHEPWQQPFLVQVPPKGFD
jgi:CheY-like chemotaxis protein